MSEFKYDGPKHLHVGCKGATVLFIGGQKDGQRVTVSEILPHYQCERLSNDGHRLTFRDGNQDVPVEILTYHWIPVKMDGGSHGFYVLQGMSVHEAFCRLLFHYKPVQEVKL